MHATILALIVAGAVDTAVAHECEDLCLLQTGFLARRSAGFRVYRFRVTKLRQPKPGAMAIADFEYSADGAEATRLEDTHVEGSTDGEPFSQWRGPKYALDSNSKTVFATRAMASLVLTFAEPVTLARFRFRTVHKGTWWGGKKGGGACDPVRWVLEGKDSSGGWEPLLTQSDDFATPLERLTWTSWIEVPTSQPETQPESTQPARPADQDSLFVQAPVEPAHRRTLAGVARPASARAAVVCCGKPGDDANPTVACPGGGSDEVCAWSFTALGLSKTGLAVAWPSAQQTCADRELRLCTLAEIHADEAADLEGPFRDADAPLVWTADRADACGNGRTALYEACDDGNVQSGDGCDAQCAVEVGYLCRACGDRSCCEPEAESGETLSRHAAEIGSIARAQVNAQVHVDELSRMTGSSGVHAGRQYRNTDLPAYERDSYVSEIRGPCGIHNHADHINTVGLADCGVVLNGFPFRTRHNDYSLKRPVQGKGFNTDELIEWPAVPPSVAGSVEEQTAEMREYFRAWMMQDTSLRDYKAYFPAQLCYLEGWLEYSTEDGELADPFESERHKLEADTWHELMDLARVRLMAGEKSLLENGAYLPQVVVDVKDEKPVVANFVYAMKCHTVSEDVPFDRFRPTSDLSTGTAGRTSLFEVDPVCRKAYDPERGPFTMSWAQRAECRKVGQTYLDELMKEVPGKDNYGAEIYHDNLLDPETDEKLNYGYYTRVYKSVAKDANNVQLQMRGFHDQSLWVAETTDPRVVAFSGRRFSWAIPFEVVYMTPLKRWNPHKIREFPNYLPNIRGDGCKRQPKGTSEAELAKCAWTGIRTNHFYQTPAELWSSLDDGPRDTADTSGGAEVVLDGDGTPRSVVASGISIFTPKLDGVHARMRYPIFPLHEESTTVWKEVKALQALLMPESFAFPGYVAGPKGGGRLARVVLAAEDHAHSVPLSPDLLSAVAQGQSVVVNTSRAADGHSHAVDLAAACAAGAGDHNVRSAEHPPLGREVSVTHVDGAQGRGGHEVTLEDERAGAPAPSLLETLAEQQRQIAQLQQLVAGTHKALPPFKQVRFVATRLRGWIYPGFLLLGDVQFAPPPASVTASCPGATHPGGMGCETLTDGDPGTSFLDKSQGNTVTFTFDQPVALESFRFATGKDGWWGRTGDPLQWRVEGLSGEHWVPLQVQGADRNFKTPDAAETWTPWLALSADFVHNGAQWTPTFDVFDSS